MSEGAASDAVTTALGAVVAGLPGGGEPREGQVQMALAVAGAISAERHLVVRAGTGTGKSFAYLVPAVLSHQRVVVATATKALQEQLVEKDLVALGERVGTTFRSSILKGRSNYLCAQRVREAREAAAESRLELDGEAASGRLAKQAEAIFAWAEKTTTGDIGELAVEPEARLWSSFSVTADECPGVARCPSGGECFAEAARRRAAESDVVVVNLHLLGAHLASGEMVLPDYDVVVIDEAHELEEVMSRSLGGSIGPARLRAVVALARAAVPVRARGPLAPLGEATERAGELPAAWEKLLSGRIGERIGPQLDDELADLITLSDNRLVALDRVLDAAGASGESGAASQRARAALARLRTQLSVLSALGDGVVAWVSGTPAAPLLEIAPIDVSEVLASGLFGATSTILTSATIPPALATRLGAPAERTDELDVGSPFAFEEHALLYCATRLPDRRDPASDAPALAELLALIEAAGGRTLALFTSRAAMSKAAAAAREACAFPVLLQGEGSKAELIATFRDSPETCLFATMGYWQGIDVPGATLSLVAIDRLPFARPNDPLVAARRERAGREAFRTIDLPRAAMLLAQGAGRLIRTAEDRGVVAVLDPRLAKASYAWDLVRALPPMRRTKDRAEAERFLRALRAAAPGDEATEASRLSAPSAPATATGRPLAP